MGDRSELTRLASHLTTDPVGTEVALLGAGASSVGAEAGAVGSPEVSATLRNRGPWGRGVALWQELLLIGSSCPYL